MIKLTGREGRKGTPGYLRTIDALWVISAQKTHSVTSVKFKDRCKVIYMHPEGFPFEIYMDAKDLVGLVRILPNWDDEGPDGWRSLI